MTTIKVAWRLLESWGQLPGEDKGEIDTKILEEPSVTNPLSECVGDEALVEEVHGAGESLAWSFPYGACATRLVYWLRRSEHFEGRRRRHEERDVRTSL